VKSFLIVLLGLAVSGAALADGATDCKAGEGVYRSGVVVRPPIFKHGQYRKGIELSHTHLSLRADQDGKNYDVAIDNVFASGFDPRERGVPASLGAIRVNDHLEMCGQLYTSHGVGIHWVHTNCGKRPTPSKPNGWIRKRMADGASSQDIEGNRQYCALF
jgi:hypothetical protein